MKTGVPLFWKVLVAVLTVLCVGLLVAVIVVSVKYTDLKGQKQTEETETCPSQGSTHSGAAPKSHGLFTDLSTKEILAIREYMFKQASLKLVPFTEATVDSNYIYMIQAKLPAKEDVLSFLEEGASKPKRKAVVVIFHGGSEAVREYLVSGQLNNSDSVTHTQRGSDINFNVRPFDRVQNAAIEKVVQNITSKLHRLLNESYDGYSYWNCTEKCLTFIPQAPFGGKDYKTEGRTAWLKFVRDLEGKTLHPVSFEILLDFSGADVSQWKAKQFYYNGQAFDTVEDLIKKYDEGTIEKVVISSTKEKPLFSSFERRGKPLFPKPLRAPKLYEPDGRRYTVNGQHVVYMLWSFDFRLDSISGLQLLDIKFDGSRIAYELSVQEGLGFHAGHSPFLATARFVYSAWALGARSFELVRGVDCPDTAFFFDSVHHVNSVGPQFVKNAVCLFEMDMGVPLRRHYANDHVDDFEFYGGLGNHALVLRTISTIFETDVIFDFIFYQNGAIEGKVRTAGYLQTAYTNEKEQPSYGYEIHEKIIGTTQEHLFNFKVDLDIAGKRNSFESISINEEAVTDSAWFKSGRQRVVRRDEKRNERDTLVEFTSSQKSEFFNVYSSSENAFKNKRGYLVRPGAQAPLPSPGWFRTNSAPWSLYKLCVTKRKSSEEKSSSMYNQVNPIRVDFENFFQDNDDIQQTDLVAWVTMGTVHLSHAEDVPSVTTAGNAASFVLEPFNYFDFDPSIRSTNAVVMRPGGGESRSVQVERYGTPTGPPCVPRDHTFQFNGTDY